MTIGPYFVRIGWSMWAECGVHLIRGWRVGLRGRRAA